MSKFQASDSMSGMCLLRKIEDHLFETEPEVGRVFWRRAKNETATYTDNQNSCGWSGHDRDKIVKLAAEFGIEVELIK